MTKQEDGFSGAREAELFARETLDRRGIAAQRRDVPGQPRYYLQRQAAFFVVGLILTVVLSRLDYSRLREIKYGVYGVLLAMIVAVQLLGSVSRGSRRSIELPFFSFQASELGKVLLVVALAAFVVDRSRRLQAATRPPGSCS